VSVGKGGYDLREPTTSYNSDIDLKDSTISQKNTYLLSESIYCNLDWCCRILANTLPLINVSKALRWPRPMVLTLYG